MDNNLHIISSEKTKRYVLNLATDTNEYDEYDGEEYDRNNNRNNDKSEEISYLMRIYTNIKSKLIKRYSRVHPYKLKHSVKFSE